jgi:hypothetical protein
LAVHDGGVDNDAGERCQHQRHGKGCAIYARRPNACRLWNCAWLGGDFEGRRPDHAHYVVDILPDYVTQRDPDTGRETHCPVVQVWVDPMHPDAHRDPALRAYLQRRGEREGMVAIIRYNSRDGFVLVPPSMSQGRGWLEKGGEIVDRGYDFADVAHKVGGGKISLVYSKGKKD